MAGFGTVVREVVEKKPLSERMFFTRTYVHLIQISPMSLNIANGLAKIPISSTIVHLFLRLIPPKNRGHVRGQSSLRKDILPPNPATPGQVFAKSSLGYALAKKLL